MQLFTVDQLLQMRSESMSYVSEFVGALIGALWQNILDFFPALITALVAHDWTEAITRVLILAASIVIIYRIIRRMPQMVLGLVTD